MIDKLNYVLALARERHFGRAAESCGVTQPTMSAGLKQLEETLGVVIVRRSSRFQGFTPEGDHVLAWARRIVGDSQAMRQEIDALKRGLAGHVRLAVIPTAVPILPKLITPFRQAHPATRFTVLSSTSIEMLEGLANLSIEAGVTYLDNEPLGDVASVPLYHESYLLLTNADGPFGNRDEVSWRELGDLPLCLMTPDMQNRRIINQLLRESGAKPDAALESNSVLALITHVTSGSCSSIVPSSLPGAVPLPEHVRAIPLTAPAITHLIGLIVPQRYAISPLTNALVREANRLAETLLPTSGT